MRVAGIAPVDAEALDALCRSEPIAALYVLPANDNPTAATIEAGERAALAAVARRHGVQIIEDDAYGQLAEAPRCMRRA